MQELCLGGSLRDKVLKQMTMWNKARPEPCAGLKAAAHRRVMCAAGQARDSLAASVGLSTSHPHHDHDTTVVQSWLQALYIYTEGLRWATQIAEGLAYLHGLNPTIIHRDLKLDNVLMSGEACSMWAGGLAEYCAFHVVWSRTSVLPKSLLFYDGKPAISSSVTAGKDGQWDAKIADFGLHATVDARNKSETMQHM